MNKCKKFIISDSLREWSENSTTEFIDESKDEELIGIAKKHNILIPSPDISIFKTIYARVDVPNKNNVVISKEAAIKGLPSLIAKQINLEHSGSGFVCGNILDAKMDGDFIVIYGCFYKSLFEEKFEQLKQLIKEKKASVSFEIWNLDPKTKKSVIKELGNGIKEINPVLFHGCGLLLEHEPACKEAYLSKLLAREEIEKDRVFSEELVYATLTIKEECQNCGDCTCQKDKEEKVMIKCEKCGKEFEPTADEKICVDCASLPKEESKTQTSEETKTEEKAVETKTEEKSEVAETNPAETKAEETTEAPKAEAEAKVEEPKVEEKAEEQKEEAQPLEVIEPKVIVKVTSIFSETCIDTYVDGTISGTSEVKGLRKRITEYKDGTKDEVEEVVEIKKKFDFAEVEEKVNAAKAEKDAEIAILKTEHEKVLGEKDKELTQIKQELGKKDQEIADIKNPKVEAKKEEPKEKEMEVGSVIVNGKSDLDRRAEAVNQIIAEKHKQ